MAEADLQKKTPKPVEETSSPEQVQVDGPTLLMGQSYALAQRTSQSRLMPRDVMALQRTVGNRAVARMLGREAQPRAQARPANDVAERVLRTPECPQSHAPAGRVDGREGDQRTHTSSDGVLMNGGLIQRDPVGRIDKAVIRKSNTIHLYDWTNKGFVRSDKTVAKGKNLAEARPTLYKEYAWIVTEDGVSGYVRTKNLTVKSWGPVKNPRYEDKDYLDENRLLARVGAREVQDKEYESANREWYLDQAILMKAYRASKDEATKKQLALAMLQSFAKSATHSYTEASEMGLQLTPLIRSYFYHRSTGGNTVLNDLRLLVAKEMNVQSNVFQMISDPLFMQVLAREFSVYSSTQKSLDPEKPNLEPVQTKIGDTAQFAAAIEAILKNMTVGVAPESTFVLDVTEFYNKTKCKPDEMDAKIARPLETILLRKLSRFLRRKGNDWIDQDKVVESVLDHIQLVILTKVKGIDVLLVPKLFEKISDDERKTYSGHELTLRDKVNLGTRKVFMEQGGHDSRKLDSAMIESGARLDPIAAKKAMLDFVGPKELLSKAGAVLSELGTSDLPTPVICKNIDAFLKTSTFTKFRQLSEEPDAPPYQRIYPAATADLLAGLAEVSKDKGGVDKVFEDKQLTDVLQHAYYRMLNAMASAILFKGNVPQFLNNIELLHDQLQMILAIAEPHEPGVAFSNSIKQALKLAPVFPEDKKNTAPTVPSEFNPLVHHKASAMHSIASILSALELEKEGRKGTRALNALVLKDNYYEAHGAVLEHSKTFTVQELNGWELRNEKGENLELKAKAFSTGKLPPKGSIDIFICDFHHNISVERSEYRVENVTHQVDELFKNGLVSENFTVAIDCTVDFVRSEDIQKFLEFHKERIVKGQLNVVLYRSAQKFDMLGMDNYYGGYTITINNEKDFKAFNERMNAKEDQVSGLSHQGLSHLAQFGSEHIEAYRKALMDNTKKLYDLLVQNGLGDPDGPIYIGKTTDPRNVFLDIQFPGASEDAGKYFSGMLKKWAARQGMSLTSRPSFGFPTSNLTIIAGSKVRLNPGLESEKELNLYVTFFTAIKDMLQKRHDEVFQTKPRDQWDPKELEAKLNTQVEYLFRMKEYEKILPIEAPKDENSGKGTSGKGTSGKGSKSKTKEPKSLPPTITGPQGVPNSGVKNTKPLEKLLPTPKSTKTETQSESTLTSLPKPAPLTFGKNIDPNPVLYFQPNNAGDFNFHVSTSSPGGQWTRVEQFCSYLAVYWLKHVRGTGNFGFASLSLLERQAAVQTLIDWSAQGLVAQEQHARSQLGGATVAGQTVRNGATIGTYAAGTKIWFGTDIHAQAAVVLSNGNYRVYDPNTGLVTEMSGANFATYAEGATSFVVA